MQFYAVLKQTDTDLFDEKSLISYEVGVTYKDDVARHRVVPFENVWINYNEFRSLVFIVEVAGKEKKYKNFPGSRYYPQIKLVGLMSHNNLLAKAREERPKYAFDREPLLNPILPFGKGFVQPSPTDKDLSNLAIWADHYKAKLGIKTRSTGARMIIERQYQRDAIEGKHTDWFGPIRNSISEYLGSDLKTRWIIAQSYDIVKYGAMGMLFEQCLDYARPLTELLRKGYIPICIKDTWRLVSYTNGQFVVHWRGQFSKLKSINDERPGQKES